MSTSFPRLNALLAVDAATCAVMSAGLMITAQPVASFTALPAPFLFWAGALLLPIAAFMVLAARRTPVPRAMAGFVVLGNLGWVVASLLLPLLGFVTPNALGWALLVGQAAAVTVLATLEAEAMSVQSKLAA